MEPTYLHELSKSNKYEVKPKRMDKRKNKTGLHVCKQVHRARGSDRLSGSKE